MTNAELFWRTLGWFWLVWFASAGVLTILVQSLLPRAWEQIRAHPPRGPAWAHRLWYGRAQVYGALMALAVALGVVAAATFLATNV